MERVNLLAPAVCPSPFYWVHFTMKFWYPEITFDDNSDVDVTDESHVVASGEEILTDAALEIGMDEDDDDVDDSCVVTNGDVMLMDVFGMGVFVLHDAVTDVVWSKEVLAFRMGDGFVTGEETDTPLSPGESTLLFKEVTTVKLLDCCVDVLLEEEVVFVGIDVRPDLKLCYSKKTKL